VICAGRVWQDPGVDWRLAEVEEDTAPSVAPRVVVLLAQALHFARQSTGRVGLINPIISNLVGNKGGIASDC